MIVYNNYSPVSPVQNKTCECGSDGGRQGRGQTTISQLFRNEHQVMVIWLLLAQSSLDNQNQSFVHVLLFKNILNRKISIYLDAFQINYLKS